MRIQTYSLLCIQSNTSIIFVYRCSVASLHWKWKLVRSVREASKTRWRQKQQNIENLCEFDCMYWLLRAASCLLSSAFVHHKPRCMSRTAKGSFTSTSKKHGKQTIASFCEYNFATALIAGLTSAAFKCFLTTECHRKPARSARQLGLEFWRLRISISLFRTKHLNSPWSCVFCVPLLSGRAPTYRGTN